MSTIFSAPYWPTPEGPPSFRIDLSIEKTETGIMIVGEVSGSDGHPRWAFNNTDNKITDPESPEAKIKALYAMVDHLAQCLADARKGK